MKIPTDNIFQLIHSMSASEKRYFKRHYASEKSLTTELFDYINGMDIYNEDVVKKNFADTKVAKNLKVYKVQLSDLLLKSLVSYHNKNNIRSKIRMGLEEVEILMDKQLYAMASSKLQKIKKLCLQHEELEYIFSIMYFEILLNSFFNIDLKPSQYPMLEELTQYTDTIKNIYRLKKVNFSLNDAKNNKLTRDISEEETAYYKDFYNTETAKSTDDTYSLNEQYYLNSALSIIQQMIFESPEEEYNFKKRNVELFANHPSFIENHADFYFAALFNFTSCCRNLKKFSEMETGIAQIKALVEKYPFLQRNLMFIYYLETKHNFQMGKYKYISNELETPISKHISRFGQKEAHLTALTFIYFIMTFLVLNDHQKVQFYFRRLHGFSKSLDKNYIHFISILEFITHYESNNSFAIQNLTTSFLRKFKKNPDTNLFFKKMVLFFEKLNQSKPEEINPLVKNFQEELPEFHADGVHNLTQEFILEDWLNALLKKESFASYILNKKQLPKPM